MRYQGGKSRISKQIAEIIEREREREDVLVSLFCGTCSIESKLVNFNKIICNDNNIYLIEMLRASQNKYDFPDVVTYKQYKYIKEHKDENKALTGFVGFGCSFGGKWFGGYARDKKGNNYANISKNSLEKDMKLLRDKTIFTCLDYKDVDIPNNAIVYADPPYENTTQYKNKFDSKSFWNYMRKISKTNKVFVSEQNAPNDFKCIWEKQIRRTLDVNKQNNFKATERLFVYNG